MGYATEGTIELLKYGFDKLSLERIVAIAQPENKASRRVLEKSGFIEKGMIPDPFSKSDKPQEVVYFQIQETEAR